MVVGTSSSTPLAVQGVSCTVFKDGAINPEEHLIQWSGDTEALVDRFDGRLLLETPHLRRENAQEPLEAEDVTEAEIQTERYGDLDYSKEEELSTQAGWFRPVGLEETDNSQTGLADEIRGQEASGSGAEYAAVGFSYESSQPESGLAEAAHKEMETAEPFVPPFPLPPDLKVPANLRMHKIIARTALFVRGAGRQSEFVLRVKHAENPNFRFLMPTDPLHPYFDWLLDNKEALADESLEKEKGNAPATTQAQAAEETALGLLSSYGSGSADSPRSTSFTSTLSQVVGKEAGKATDSGKAGENSAVRGPQPPPEVQAVIEKLVKFVQKAGKKFEASAREREKRNPRFAFLDPDNAHFWFYRQQLCKAIGEEAADDILPKSGNAQVRLGIIPAVKVVSTARSLQIPEKEKSPAEQRVAQFSGAIRRNPSLVKIAYRPLPESRNKALDDNMQQTEVMDRDLSQTGMEKSDQAKRYRGDSAPHAGRKSHSGTSDAKSGGLKPSGSVQGGQSKIEKKVDKARSLYVIDSDDDFLRATQGPNRNEAGQQIPSDQSISPPQKSSQDASVRNSEEEEQKKASRLRLARQLLMQKQSGRQSESKEKRELVGSIHTHRSALLAEEVALLDDLAGREGSAGSAEGPSKVPSKLPALDELLQSKRFRPIDRLSDFEVLAAESTSVRAEDAADKKRQRSRTTHADSSSSSDSERQRQKSERKKISSSARRDQRKEDKRRARHNELETATGQPDEMTARIRALLRTHQSQNC